MAIIHHLIIVAIINFDLNYNHHPTKSTKSVVIEIVITIIIAITIIITVVITTFIINLYFNYY